MQKLINSISEATRKFGLTFSIKKTEEFFNIGIQLPEILIHGKVFNNVNSFAYLGSTISSNNSLDKEISSGIAKVNASFWTL